MTQRTQEQENDFSEGYRDGILFHMDFINNARNPDKYIVNEHYTQGFDQAGQDS